MESLLGVGVVIIASMIIISRKNKNSDAGSNIRYQISRD